MSSFEVSVSKTDTPSSKRLRHTESQLIYHLSYLLAMENHLVFQTGYQSGAQELTVCRDYLKNTSTSR